MVDMKKNRKKADQTARKLKAAGVKPLLKGDWEKHREEYGAPKAGKAGVGKHKLSADTKLAIAKDKMAGATSKELAIKYDCSVKLIELALKHAFIATEKGKHVLKGILLENAVATGMKVKEGVEDLTTMQAAVVTGVMTQRFIELDKHMQGSNGADVDFNGLIEVGKILSGLDGIIEGEEGESPVIDV